MKKSSICVSIFCMMVTLLSFPAFAERRYSIEDEGIFAETLLVNLENRLPYDFEPEDLIVPEVLRPKDKKERRVYLRPEAAKALEDLFAAAKEEGYTLYAISGYRSYYEQRMLFEEKVELVGEKRAMKIIAKQGSSEHQLGLVMDINGETTLKDGLVESFGESDEGKWVASNAYRFGFIIRYPKDKTDITGIQWEPWHLRYVGKKAAVEIYTLDTTLEEYHELYSNQK